MDKIGKRQDMTKSEAFEEQFFKPVCHQKMINGYRNFTSEINWGKKSSHLPKKIETRVLYFNVRRYSRPQEMRDNHLKKFQSVISSSKQIHTLNIDLSDDCYQTRREFDLLCHFIRGQTSLKHLSFRFAQDFRGFSTEIEIQNFCQTLKGLFSLQTLSLDFKKSRNLTDRGLSKLGETLRTLISLRKCRLVITGHQKIIPSLSRAFRNLCSLALILNLKEEGCDDAQLQNLGQAFEKLVSLQSIELDLSYQGVDGGRKGFTKVGIDSLSEGLKSLPLLIKVSLKFRGCEDIKGKVIPSFGEKLEVLLLDFSGCFNLDDTGLSNLGESIKSLNSLKNIDLKLLACEKVTNTGVIYIGQALRSLGSLQTIGLNFNENNNIFDQGLGSLVRDFKSIHSLQNLNLDFSQCSQIGNQGIIEFSRNLGQFTQLKELSLNFRRCQEISEEEGLENLYLSLQGLKTLLKLKLHLDLQELGVWWLSDISMEGKDHLGHTLKALTSLRSIDLSFKRSSIKEKGMRNLCQGLENHPSLQSLSLDFSECDFSGETFEILCKALKTLTSLQNIKLKLPPEQDSGSKYLRESFRNLIALKSVDFEGNFEFEASSYSFCSVLKGIRSLETLRLRLALTEEWIYECYQILETFTWLKTLDFESFYED